MKNVGALLACTGVIIAAGLLAVAFHVGGLTVCRALTGSFTWCY